MAEPVHRRSDADGGKFYEHPSRTEPVADGTTSPDGTPWTRPARYLSVTQALSVKAKPALVFWSGNVTADRAMDNLPKLVVDAFKPGCGRARARKEPYGCGNCVDCTTAWLALTHHGEKERRAREGTAAHDVLERWILTGEWLYTPALSGDPAVDQYVPTQEVIKPYIDALQAWVADYALTQADFLVSECTVWNHRLKYAGTLDFIVVIHPRTKKAAELCARVNHLLGQPLDAPVTILGDAKSREGEGAELYAEQPLQLVAYRNAETMTPKRAAGDMEIPMIATDGAAILQVRPDGFTFRLMVADGRTMRAWEATLALARWDADHGALATQVQAHPLPDGWEYAPPKPAELLAEGAEASRPVKKAAAPRKRAAKKATPEAVPADEPTPGAAARLGATSPLADLRHSWPGARGGGITDADIPF